MLPYIFQIQVMFSKKDLSFLYNTLALVFFAKQKLYVGMLCNCRCTALNKKNLLLCNIFYPHFDMMPIYYTLTCNLLLCIALSQVFLMRFLFLVHFFYQNSQNVILNSIILETKYSFCNALMT